MAEMTGEHAGTIVVAFVLGAVTRRGGGAADGAGDRRGDARASWREGQEGREKAAEAARQGREFLNRQRDTLGTAIERGREAYNQARARRRPVRPGESPVTTERGVPRRHRRCDAGDGADPGRGDHRDPARRPPGAADDHRRSSSDVRPLIATRPPRSGRRSVADRDDRHRPGQKIDRLLTDLAVRVDETAASSSRRSSRRPAKGWRSSPRSRPASAALRGHPRASPPRPDAADEEDPLFIG